MKSYHSLPTAEPGFKTFCADCYKKLIVQIEKAKAAVLNEFSGSLQAHQHLLRLALNEAEAMAWDTGVPHLVFPTLAREKAQSVAAWEGRQRLLRRRAVALAFES